MSYLRKNFATATLSSNVLVGDNHIHVTAGHNLPTVVGDMILVIWDREAYDNPADDPNTEIVVAQYSSPNVYAVTRAQEDTIAFTHSSGDTVAMHLTAGLSSNDLLFLGTLKIDESGFSDNMFLNKSGSSIIYRNIINSDVPSALSGKTYNDLTLTSQATGFTLSGGILSKTLTISGDSIIDQSLSIDSSPTFKKITLSQSDVTAPYLEIENISSTVARFPNIALTNYAGDTVDALGYFNFRKASGSKISPSIADANGRIGEILFQAHDGTDFRSCLSMRCYADSTFDSTHRHAYLSIFSASGVGSISEKIRFTYDGKIGVKTSSPDRGIEINDADGNCLRLTYNDPNGSAANYVDYLVTSGGNGSITPSGGFLGVIGSLKVGDGGVTNYGEFESDGTLKFNGGATVWNDANVGAMTLTLPASSQPDEVNFVDELGADTGIPTWGFAVGEKVGGCIEIPHDYKEGTDLTFHVHWQGITSPAGGTDNVKWQLTYTVSSNGGTLDAVTVITKESAITTRYSFVRSDFIAITGTNFKIGDQFIFSLERVAASADEYAGDALVGTIGFHYECDTCGSRSITTK